MRQDGVAARSELHREFGFWDGLHLAVSIANNHGQQGEDHEPRRTRVTSAGLSMR